MPNGQKTGALYIPFHKTFQEKNALFDKSSSYKVRPVIILWKT